MASIGYEGTDVNAPLGILAVQLRDACRQILQEWSYVNRLGVAGLEAAPYSMDSVSAQALFDAYNYLQTVANIYYGTAAQPDPFDFDDALALIRGGQ